MLVDGPAKTSTTPNTTVHATHAGKPNSRRLSVPRSACFGDAGAALAWRQIRHKSGNRAHRASGQLSSTQSMIGRPLRLPHGAMLQSKASQPALSQMRKAQ